MSYDHDGRAPGSQGPLRGREGELRPGLSVLPDHFRGHALEAEGAVPTACGKPRYSGEERDPSREVVDL